LKRSSILIILPLILLFMFLIYAYYPAKITVENLKYRVTYTIQFSSIKETTLHINVSLPQSSYQEIERINFSIHPSSLVLDEHQNKIAYFNIILKPEHPFNISIAFNVVVKQLYKRRICSEKYIESDAPRIIEKAKEIVGAQTNPIFAAQRICDWVYKNINWTGYSARTRGALWALKNRQGDCSEKAHLFIDLCRAAGIPARLVHGISYVGIKDGGVFNWTTIGHDWAEIYVTNYGWIWVDPTWGLFGSSDIYHIALQHGYSSALGKWYRFRFVGDAEFKEIFEIRLAE